MTKTHKITIEDGITKVKFLVNPGYELVQSIIDDLAENYPYERRLWDMSEINFDFTSQEIQSIAQYGKQKFTETNKLAIYAVKDLAYGEMRQFEVYREEEHKTVARVFRSEHEAIEWLKS